MILNQKTNWQLGIAETTDKIRVREDELPVLNLTQAEVEAIVDMRNILNSCRRCNNHFEIMGYSLMIRDCVYDLLHNKY